MAGRFRGRVVVITGASSGIGLSAAKAFARKGASVVLGARSNRALQSAAEACEREGGHAIAVPVDVSDENQVQALASRALEAFGRIDVWLNNAAVTLFSRFEEAPSEDFRRVFDVNFFGYVHGARAALPVFREQGHGVLINNASVAGLAGTPYLSAYVSTEFAILGLTECLRQEVLDNRDIHVCAVLPASIDTPIFHNAANYTGWAVKPLSPIYGPEKVARAIVRLARRPRRQIRVGRGSRMQSTAKHLSPALSDRLTLLRVERGQFQDRPAPRSRGNLFEPRPGWTGETGSWRLAGGGASRSMPTSLLILTTAALGGLWYYRSMSPAARRALSVGTKVAAAKGMVFVGRRLLGLLRTRPGRALVMVVAPRALRAAAPTKAPRIGKRPAGESRR